MREERTGNGKARREAKAYHTYTYRNKLHTATAFCVTDRVGVQLRPQTKPALKDVGLQPYCHTQA